MHVEPTQTLELVRPELTRFNQFGNAKYMDFPSTLYWYDLYIKRDSYPIAAVLLKTKLYALIREYIFSCRSTKFILFHSSYQYFWKSRYIFFPNFVCRFTRFNMLQSWEWCSIRARTSQLMISTVNCFC